MNKLVKLVVVVILLAVVGSIKADNQLQKAADLYAAQSYEQAADVYAKLLEYELDNVVAAMPGGRYQRIKKH